MCARFSRLLPNSPSRRHLTSRHRERQETDRPCNNACTCVCVYRARISISTCVWPSRVPDLHARDYDPHGTKKRTIVCRFRVPRWLSPSWGRSKLVNLILSTFSFSTHFYFSTFLSLICSSFWISYLCFSIIFSLRFSTFSVINCFQYVLCTRLYFILLFCFSSNADSRFDVVYLYLRICFDWKLDQILFSSW